MKTMTQAEREAEAARLEALAVEAEGMADAAYGHGATLMGESYAQTAHEARRKARALRAHNSA